MIDDAYTDDPKDPVAFSARDIKLNLPTIPNAFNDPTRNVHVPHREKTSLSLSVCAFPTYYRFLCFSVFFSPRLTEMTSLILIQFRPKRFGVMWRWWWWWVVARVGFVV
jgi:hypothetical protein